MITIAPIQIHQVAAAKQVIAEVAQRIFEPEMSVEEFLTSLDAEHELQDLDNVQQVYGGPRSIFLVVLDDDRVVGTGALRPFDEQTAELKRLWLFEDYHGQRLGYQLVMQLFEFARKVGYGRIYLQTSLQSQRAIGFYKRLGFVEIPAYFEQPYDDDISMGIDLNT
jgi:putative acetyltransferase